MNAPTHVGTEVLTLTRRGSVVLATLNRPTKSNSLNQPLITALDDLAEQIEDSYKSADGTRALIVTGAGTRAFSAGADVTELDNITRTRAFEQMRRGQEVFGRLERLPVPVIMAINGFALGGGLELAMAGDVRIAAPSARLGLPEITLENLPSWGGAQRLPRLVGRAIATEMILTGKLIGAVRALGLGLINQVSEDVVDAALELAAEIAPRNPRAVAGAKLAIREGLEGGLEHGLVVEAEQVAECCTTAAQRAAVSKFLNRKKK